MRETKSNRLAGQYLAALRTHLEHGRPASLQVAHELGGEAVARGLETLDMARIHDQALETLILPDCSPVTQVGMHTRAVAFFTEAITPIEETHRHALEVSADLQRVNALLCQRMLDLADSHHDLKQGIIQRKAAEAALETSEQSSSQLLKDSRFLEKDLKDETHNILVANEAERKSMSLLLHDEIGQTLLGIHVRLLALKKKVSARHAGLDKEITTTQRLVEESVKTINRFAHEFDIPQET